MAEQQKPQGQQGQGRGIARGRGQKKGPGGPRREEEQWKPVTKLGRLVKSGRIESIDDIFRFAIPIKEPEIPEHLLKEELKEEVMKVKPVQKQTKAGQRTRFKAVVIVGDHKGHLGCGWKCSKEVQGAIKGAIIHAKLQMVPIRFGYWGNRIGNAHTVPCKVTGKCGSVSIRIIPAPRGTGIVAAPTSKKVLQMAGIGDAYTSSTGNTKTKSNFVKATFYCLTETYKFLTPDFWGEPKQDLHPFEEHAKWLTGKSEERVEEQQQEKRRDDKRYGGRPRFRRD